MASDPLLDFDALLAPIPGDNPAGEPTPFGVRQQLEEDRKEILLEDFAADDPMKPDSPKYADFANIIRLSKETLATKSKDLMLGSRLTEALVRKHGFEGLAAGFRLLRLMLEQCWDRMYPSIEDGDLEVRVAPFSWLDEADRGARFPMTLSQVTIAQGHQFKFSSYQYNLLRDAATAGKSEHSKEEFERAMEESPVEQAKQIADALGQASQDLTQITAVLQEKIGGAAPGMAGVRKAIEECNFIARSIIKKHEAAQAEAGESTDGQQGGGGSSAPVGGSRESAYRQLANAAAILRRLEPHSPIPYLIERAVALGAMPFPLLIKELVRDGNILGELNREFGIREEQPPAS